MEGVIDVHYASLTSPRPPPKYYLAHRWDSQGYEVFP